MSQELRSLQFAKYQVWKKLEKECNAMFGTYLKNIKYTPFYQLYLSAFDCNLSCRISRCPLKYIDSNGKMHVFKIELPSGFFIDYGFDVRDGKYLFSFMSSYWTSFIINKIWQLSDEGMKFVLDFKQTKTRAKVQKTFLEPYQGAKMQIEADFMSPDYASMDESLLF